MTSVITKWKLNWYIKLQSTGVNSKTGKLWIQSGQCCSHKLPLPSLQFPTHFLKSRYAMHSLNRPKNLPLMHGL